MFVRGFFSGILMFRVGFLGISMFNCSGIVCLVMTSEFWIWYLVGNQLWVSLNMVFNRVCVGWGGVPEENRDRIS